MSSRSGSSGILRVVSRSVWIYIRGIKSVCTMRRCRVRTISRWRSFDPFGRGYAKYSFQNLCKEDRELYLKDGTEKIFYNCAADPEKVPENLRELYDYIRSGKVGGDLSRRIDEAVCMARKNEEWRSEYMKELLHDDDVREEGRAEGRAEGREEGEGQLVKLINSMIAGGDGDKIALFGEPEILKTMKQKYGIN